MYFFNRIGQEPTIAIDNGRTGQVRKAVIQRLPVIISHRPIEVVHVSGVIWNLSSQSWNSVFYPLAITYLANIVGLIPVMWATGPGNS